MAVVIPALDARFFTTTSLDEYFVNKDTGLPLANGQIWFYQDTSRTTPKLVYTLSDNPPTYNTAPPNPPLPNPNYVALPNPITLSAVGQPQDINNNNVPIYYFPYDAAGNIQLYYIVIKDQFGTIQETRHAWPNIATVISPPSQDGMFNNALSNPQFIRALFLPNNPLTVTNSAGAGNVTYSLFPDWNLFVVWSGNGSFTVQRNAIAGSAALPGNPPYTVTFTPGLGINGWELTQTLSQNPDIFSANAAGNGGYISASLLLAPGSSINNMQYSPNNIPAQTTIILNANNTSGSFAEFTQTTQLPPALNANTADTGFVNIIINLPVTQATTLSNVQVLGLQANIQNITWTEYPSNRQIDQLFNYYKPLLEYKAISSYLIGWDFAFNPAQVLTSTVAASAAGQNTSSYTWDQTILFQTANNAIATSRALTGSMTLTATNTSQFALIQYLPQSEARKILNDDICAMIAGLAEAGRTINGKITLWYTTNASLPNINANASLVTGLDATGFPTVAAGWTQIPRNVYGDATFTLSGNSAGLFYNNNSFGFSGWNVFPSNNMAANTATFFAIVVGFSSLLATHAVTIGSISLMPGSIPTIPAPQSSDAVLLDCQKYYQKSFENGTLPASNVGLNSGDYQFAGNSAGGATTNNAVSIPFGQIMATVPAITFYNPNAAGANAWDYSIGATAGATATNFVSTKSFGFHVVGNAGSGTDDRFGVHWTADARLGTF